MGSALAVVELLGLNLWSVGLFILIGVRMTAAGSGAKQKSARGGVQ